MCRWSGRKCVISVLYLTFLIYFCGTVLTIWLAVTLASQLFIGRSYAGVLMYIPAILGAILVSTLPFTNKIGLLFSYWISRTFSWSYFRKVIADSFIIISLVFAIAPFPLFLSWVSSIIAGHTKRMGGLFCRTWSNVAQGLLPMASCFAHMQLVMLLVSLCGRPNTNQGVSFLISPLTTGHAKLRIGTTSLGLSSRRAISLRALPW